MVKVRLARRGSKKRPYYHLVVTDSENPRDGRFIEQVGTYDPAKPDGDATINHDRVEFWQSKGAQLSERVGDLVRSHKRASAAAAAA